MINREKIDEHARYVHEERGGGVRKALAAAATAIILLAGNLGYHKISAAGYQQVQHQLNFHISTHPEYYTDRYDNFELALIPDITKELGRVNNHNIVTALNAPEAPRPRNIIESTVTDLLHHRTAALAPGRTRPQRQKSYRQARVAEYNLSRLGLYPAASLNDWPVQTLDEFYMDYINFCEAHRDCRGAATVILEEMEADIRELATPRSELASARLEFFKKSLTEKTPVARQRAARQARMTEMLLARQNGHNLQVFEDYYQPKNLDALYLERYAREPKKRNIIAKLLTRDVFFMKTLRGPNAAPVWQAEFIAPKNSNESVFQKL